MGASFIVSVVGAIWPWFKLSETNNSSTAPGDYAAAPPAKILGSIYYYCGWQLALNLLVLAVAWLLTRDLLHRLERPTDGRRLRTAMYVLLFINATMLIGVPVVVGFDYWHKRAPYFPRAGKSAKCQFGKRCISVCRAGFRPFDELKKSGYPVSAALNGRKPARQTEMHRFPNSF